VDINQLYIDAAFRVGSSYMEYQSSSDSIVIPRSGFEETYDTHTLYYGAQLGIGYDAKVNDCSGIELYARYAWVHQKGKDITALGNGMVSDISLADANSHRVKAGGKFYYGITNKLTRYIGAGYEHEFDGRVRGTATANNTDISDLSLTGGSGFLEAGLRMIPIDTISKHLLLDVNLTGYVGEKTGVNGTLKLKYQF
jgi:outer membrane autotransporter protein